MPGTPLAGAAWDAISRSGRGRHEQERPWDAMSRSSQASPIQTSSTDDALERPITRCRLVNRLLVVSQSTTV